MGCAPAARALEGQRPSRSGAAALIEPTRVCCVRPLLSGMLWRSIAPARRPEGFIEPCLPTLGHAVPSGPQWAYEIKHDGFRFICRRYGDRVRVFSRRGNDYTDRVPAIAEALAALRVKSVTLDGEGVVCGEDGVTDFDRLRAAVGRLGSRDAFFYVFDLLEINGTDLRRDE
jgi:bifunctional non-homologous end joining protein LigD